MPGTKARLPRSVVCRPAVGDDPHVLLEGRRVVAPDRLLELRDRLRAERVALPVEAQVVVAAGVQQPAGAPGLAPAAAVARDRLGGDLLQADPADARGGPGEVASRSAPSPRPTASKICEPKKLRSVEIPMRLKVLSSPFLTAVM